MRTDKSNVGTSSIVLRGHVEQGVIVLDDPASIPNGTEVRVEILQEDQYRSLREGLLRLAGTIDNLPEDLAENHDHYLHGTTRR